MIDGLERFVVALRAAGVPASTAEWLDALRAAGSVGLADRARFRAALRCALAKRRAHQATFDRVFERFFAPPRGRSRRAKRRAESRVAGIRGAAREEDPAGGPRRDAEPRPRERFPLGALAAGRRLSRLRRVVLDPAPREPAAFRAALSPARPAARHDPRRALPAAEERELAARVERLVERIRLRSARRYRGARRGAPYPRRLFRDNLRYGGVPWVLPRRRKRRRHSRVVLLVDVSWSTARAAGLFLALAFLFLKRAARTRVLLFVDRVVDGTEAVALWVKGGSPSPHGLLASLSGLNLEAPSDYGRAFHALLRSAWHPAGRTTALVVLGDGRTNRFDPQAWAFEELARRCGVVVWLCPEPAAAWGSGDSALPAYLPHADLAVEARDLEGLARGVSELLRRL